MKHLKKFLSREPVLCISALAAVVSCFFVHPDAQYVGYVDLRTIALLYCLMVVVAGFREAGVFGVMAKFFCKKAKNARHLGFVLMLLCFFSSMLITNDVALLTFVPFTVALLMGSEEGNKPLVIIIALETLAANLGSMLTPVGNPQNLFLYSFYGMTPGVFFTTTMPVCALGLAGLRILCLFIPQTPLEERKTGEGAGMDKKLVAVCAVLFVVCLLVVVRVLAWYVALGIVVCALLVFHRRLLRRADFLLLLTFVCFFVFVGNLGRMEAVSRLLARVLTGRELLVSAALSQVISNVPAAVLLSGFTDNARALLLGVDIGGLGTPIASLASLISLKIYSRTKGAKLGSYLGWFSAMGFSLLIVLLLFSRFFLL